MTRSQALRAYREARERGDTRRMHHAYCVAKKATERVLSKSRAARWWDGAKAKRKGWCE